MKKQKQIDDLIEQIKLAEEKESVTNEMEAVVLEFLNGKTKSLEGRHKTMGEKLGNLANRDVVMSEDEYEKLPVKNPDAFYYTYEEEK